MELIQKTIELAIAGGWKPKMRMKPHKKFELEDDYIIFHDKVNVKRFPLDSVFLDPLYWSSLGKGLNLGVSMSKKAGRIRIDSPTGYAQDRKITWGEYTMFRFIDHLALEKDKESFFSSLLKEK